MILKYIYSAIVIVLLSQTGSASIQFNNLRQQKFYNSYNLNHYDHQNPHAHKGNTQQNNPTKNQLLTNQQEIINHKKNSFIFSNLGLQAYFSKSMNQQKDFTNYQEKYGDYNSDQNLRKKVDQYLVNDLQKYGFIIFVTILLMFAGFIFQNAEKLRIKKDQLNQQYETFNQKRRKQLKLKAKNSEKHIPQPDQSQNQNQISQVKVRT